MKKLIKKILKEYVDKEAGEIIKNFINDEFGLYEDMFSIPYDDSGYIDVIIQYEVTKVNVWQPVMRLSEYNYEGTVDVKVEKILIGNKNENFWESVSGQDDLPEWVWEDFAEFFNKTCIKYFGAYVDTDIDLPKDL